MQRIQGIVELGEQKGGRGANSPAKQTATSAKTAITFQRFIRSPYHTPGEVQ